jgi:transcriptional regulator with XRE-family HTH domain
MDFTKWQTDTEILSLIGERIREARIKHRLTQLQLAKLVGVTQRVIFKIEKGQQITIGSLIGILRSLDLLSGLNSLLPKQNYESIDEIENETDLIKRKRYRKKKEKKVDKNEKH